MVQVDSAAPPPPPGEIKIGETAILPADDTGNANLNVAQSVTLSQAATLETFSFYVTSAAGDLRLGSTTRAGRTAALDS